jgi:hypothetical protein
MQPLDKNTLFSIFDIGDEEVYKENNVEELLDNPFVLIGMVVRGVENWHLMDILYTRKKGEEYAEVRDKVQLQYFVKLCKYLDRLDFNKFETVYTIGESFDKDEVDDRLSQMMDVFIENEYYEQCATVKRFLDMLSHEYILKCELKKAGLRLPIEDKF